MLLIDTPTNKTIIVRTKRFDNFIELQNVHNQNWIRNY